MRRIALIVTLVAAIPGYAQQPISEDEKAAREKEMRQREMDFTCCKLPPTATSRKVDALRASAETLIKQKKIPEARVVLNQAIDLGKDEAGAGMAAAAEACFTMAETYDPNILFKWEISDPALADILQARAFYSKAFAGNAAGAAARIRALQN